MSNLRKQVAGGFALAALIAAVTPVATASAGPDTDCIKRAVAAEIHHVVDGGPVPLPCG